MIKIKTLVFASVSLMSLATPALAQSTPANDAGTTDIIVSARRREERLQDVPKVVNAVTSEDLRKNNIEKFEDVQNIVPGLNLQDAHNGLVQNASLRGASADVDSGLPSPTIQFYLNDANVQQNFIFTSMYDIGQIEVLRGPQGTLRGRSSPSGAITLTTRLPDLDSFGGFGEITAVSGPGGQKYDGALNVPIVKERLALRIAGSIDDNDGSGVHPVNRSLYPTNPFDRTWTERVSLRAKPVDNLEINLMYQHLVNHADTYVQTESTCLIDPSQPCGNGPLINAKDRLSTVNGQRFVRKQFDIWNGRVDYHLWGQKLSYVGQYALSHLSDEEPEDGANFFPPSAGPNPYQKISVDRSQFKSHEVRLASEERIAKIFDYVIGYNQIDTPTQVVAVGTAPHGAGLDALLNLSASAPITNGAKEYSWFGNVTVHPTEQLEISGGARYIIDKFDNPSVVEALGLPLNVRATHTIWTASASYHISPDVMAYVNAGSAFRAPGTNLGLAFTPFQVGVFPTGPFAVHYPSQFFQISPETSTSYEIGFKTQLLDHRLTFNIDYYHQDFTNYQYVGPDFIYALVGGADLAGLSATPLRFIPVQPFVGPPIIISTVNVPAKVDGFEGEINYRFADQGNIGGTFSYANGRVTGGAVVPCNILGAKAPLTTAAPIETCPGGAMSINPKFSATVHVDYATPITSEVTEFVRGLLQYHGATPTSPAFSPADHAPAYATADFYAGVRSPESNWELTLFVKNLFDNHTRLPTYGGNIQAVTPGQSPAANYGPNPSAGPFGSAYTYVAVVPPREFGVTLRYAFGSR
jgi:iron complex outermembrane receptor protein